MEICGIVAEYNPFHNGHMYHLQQARKLSGCDIVIAVMSGNFVQRGEPAVIDKWTRAETAVRNGADVVIELPYIYATQSASAFARGSISLLKLAGVSSVCFGSECGNLENLREIAETPVNPDHLHESLATGMSFPKAYSLLTSEVMPNDILAISYLKELAGTDIKPIAVQRTSGYNDPSIVENASALAIRKALKEGIPLADSTPMEQDLLSEEPVFMDLYYPYLRTLLLTSPRERLNETFLFNEGIEAHLCNNAKTEESWTGFLNACTNWRYTASRIRRCCLQAMNQITKESVKRLTPLDTLRILAFNENGRRWLHDMRKQDVKIASRFADVPWLYRRMEYNTTLLYTSVMPEERRNRLLDLEIKGAHYIKNEGESGNE